MSCSNQGKEVAKGDPWKPKEDNYNSPTYQQTSECSEGYLARAGNAEVVATGSAEIKGKISNISIPVQSDLSVTTLMIATTGSPSITSWSATPLPPGISFNTSSGAFSGIISLEGKYSLTVTANFSDSTSDSKSYQLVAKQFSESDHVRFIHPMPGSVVTSKCTANADGTQIWDDPKRGRPHKGIDLAFVGGTIGNVRASASGKVIRVVSDGSSQGYGNVIYIGHSTPSGKKIAITVYGHLSKIVVSEGQQVAAGDFIGVEGNVGISSGAHLHFEIRSPEFAAGGNSGKTAAVYDPLAYINGQVLVDNTSQRLLLDSGADPDSSIVNPITSTITNSDKVVLTPANADNKCNGYIDEPGNPGPSQTSNVEQTPIPEYDTNPISTDSCLTDGIEFVFKQEVGPWFDSSDSETSAGLISTYEQRLKCGYINNSDEESKFGISKNGNPTIDISTLTFAQAKTIYKNNYFDANDCGTLQYPLCIIHFDSCVNLGPAKSTLFLSQVGTPSDTEEAKQSCRIYLNVRSNYYDDLASSNPGKYGKYLNGWKARIERLKQFIESV